MLQAMKPTRVDRLHKANVKPIRHMSMLLTGQSTKEIYSAKGLALLIISAF